MSFRGDVTLKAQLDPEVMVASRCCVYTSSVSTSSDMLCNLLPNKWTPAALHRQRANTYKPVHLRSTKSQAIGTSTGATLLARLACDTDCL